MPSFVYSSVTIEQLDDIDGYAPFVRQAGTPRPPIPVAQLHSRMSAKPTLVELVKQQQPSPQQPPSSCSNQVLPAPTRDELVNADEPLSGRLARRLRWSPASDLTRDSLALSFFATVLLFTALCVDQFALTEVSLHTFAAPSTAWNPSGASVVNTLGAFTFCRAGSWLSNGEAEALVYTFTPDHHCSRIGGECTADGWSLGSMLGSSSSASCGLFDLFRAYLLIAFFCSVAAVGLGVAYVRWRKFSPVFAGAVVVIMAAVTLTTLIAGCVIQSMLPSTAAHSHSFWLLIAAILLSSPCPALFTCSEYKRLYGTPATPPDTIHSGVPPVRLTEGEEGLDEKWHRQRYELSCSHVYTLDDDHGALLAIEEGAQQPAATAAPPAITPAPDLSLRARRMSVAFIASKARVSTVDDEVLEDGEAEVSLSRIDMRQAEWDEEADEAEMENVELVAPERAGKRHKQGGDEQKTQDASD